MHSIFNHIYGSCSAEFNQFTAGYTHTHHLCAGVCSAVFKQSHVNSSVFGVAFVFNFNIAFSTERKTMTRAQKIIGPWSINHEYVYIVKYIVIFE